MLNRVFLYGRLTKDPEIRQTQSGISVMRFTVAVDGRKPKDGGEAKADFIECVAWRQTADFIGRYFTKGSAIIVEGAIHNNNYEDKNGVKHYSYVVSADNVSFGESKKSAQGNEPAQQLDPNEFEEIISDGSVPF